MQVQHSPAAYKTQLSSLWSPLSPSCLGFIGSWYSFFKNWRWPLLWYKFCIVTFSNKGVPVIIKGLLTDMQNASLCNDEIWACWTAGWPAWLKKNKSLMLLFSLNMRLRTSFHAFGVLLREIIRWVIFLKMWPHCWRSLKWGLFHTLHDSNLCGALYVCSSFVWLWCIYF